MRAARRDPQGKGEMRTEYDFSAGVRGKYAARLAQGSKVVVLAPDVAKAFPTASKVNAALRRAIRSKPHAKPSPRR